MPRNLDSGRRGGFTIPAIVLVCLRAQLCPGFDQLTLNVQALDLDAKQLEDAAGEISFPGDPITKLRKSADLLSASFDREKACPDGSVPIRLDIVVHAGGVERREIPIRTVRLCSRKGGADTYKIHLIKHEARRFDLDYISAADAVMARGADAALAYLQPAWDDYLHNTGSDSLYTCKLKLAYSRALHKTCTSDYYDTCAQANAIYSNLTSNKRCELALKLPKTLIELSRTDLTVKAAEDAFSLGDYGKSAELLDLVLDNSEKYHLDLKAIGLTKDWLLANSGTAHLKQGVKIESLSLSEALKNTEAAVARFSAVNTSTLKPHVSAVVERNKDFAAARLVELQ